MPKPQALATLQQLHQALTQEERAQRAARKREHAADRPRALSKRREQQLDGIDTSAHGLGTAHSRLREAVLSGDFAIKAHAREHARGEGFLEHDVLGVLMSGRVRAVYVHENRWLVAGYFHSVGVKLPLHVVVEPHDEGFDVVTAFVPRQPHEILSRRRLAVMLRYDREEVAGRRAIVGNRVGYKNKGRWRR